MGATTGEVLRMFNRRYAAMVLVCFAVAAPLSAWAVSRWLSTFAYRVPMHWWVFAAALLAVLAVTVLTVTVRSWRAPRKIPPIRSSPNDTETDNDSLILKNI